MTAKKDTAGEEKVRCRGCLKAVVRLRGLTKHMKSEHKGFYKKNKMKSRRWFVAEPDQLIPDDPEFQVNSGIKGPEREEEFEPNSQKRQKTQQMATPALVDFKAEFDKVFGNHEDGMSQDPFEMYMHLLQLVEHFDAPTAMDFFKSEEARVQSSKARALVESAHGWIGELSEVNLARVLFAAVGLGGSTLTLYAKWAEGLENKKQDLVLKKLRDLLHEKIYGLGFD